MTRNSPEFEAGQTAAYLSVLKVLDRIRENNDLLNGEIGLLVAQDRIARMAREALQ